MITSTKCVIIANGEFPKREIALRLLLNAETIIACDGAVKHLLAHDIEPTFIVGDLDSLSEALHKAYADRIIHIEEQESNDLSKTVRFAAEKGFREVAILAATGIREDHTLGNIALLTEYIKLLERVEIISDYGCFKAISSSASFASHPGQQVSIFVLPPLVPVTSVGLRYPIENRTFSGWWEGTLNEATGSSFMLTLDGEGKVIVYRTHPE